MGRMPSRVGYQPTLETEIADLQERIASVGGASVTAIEAVYVPADDFTDPAVGGGRIIGEACHFVDLCTYLVGQIPNGVQASALGRDPENEDSMMALVSYPDGSTASISYLANASTELPKERWEVHADGKSAICENFRVTTLPGGKKLKGLNQDKGQVGAVQAFVDAARKSSGAVMSMEEILSTSRITLSMLASAGVRE